jgi:predicted ATPase
VPDVRRRLPHLTLPEGEAERYRLFDSVADFLGKIARASNSGVLLCLDDLQWADDSTLLLLEHLCRRLANAPLLVVGAYRDTDLDVARPLARTLEYLSRLRIAQRMDVKRLDMDGVRQMLAHLGTPEPPSALVAAVYAETEGNPFFVQEVFDYLEAQGRLFDATGVWRADLRIGATEVPQSVRLVIGRRLERLTPECRTVLQLAAVLGPHARL